MLFKFDSYTIAFHDKKYHVKTGKIFFPVFKEDGPEVYRKIENILAALPGDMGQKARWAAEKMVAEVFAEYLKVRLRVEENEKT